MVIVAITIIFNIAKSAKTGNMPLTQKLWSYISVPFLSLGNSFDSMGNNIRIYFSDKKETEKAIAKLSEENRRLSAENRDLKSKAARFHQMEELLAFSESVSFESKGARLLYFSPSHWFRKAVLDLGEKDGVKMGFPAVTAHGLAGQISSVSKNRCVLDSVTCEDTVIGGSVERNRLKGLVRGNGSRLLRFDYLKADSDIKPGDIIVTSGDGSLIPTGIPIGKVKDIRKDSLTDSATAYIKPFVDFNSTDRLLVVISKSPLLGDK